MASKGPECSICFEGYNDKDKCPRILSYTHLIFYCSRLQNSPYVFLRIQVRASSQTKGLDRG